jgi:glycosyltransferase involved in cell wall biosynthesis
MPFSDGLVERASVFFRRHLLGRIADRVIANSYFNSSQIALTCSVSEENISVIYNGIDPVFTPSSQDNFNEYGAYILYVGGTTRHKNLSRLIKAHSLLLGKGFDINLVIVGGVYTTYYDIPLDHLLGKDLPSRKKIIIHGIERDSKILTTLYRNARLVVFPSLVESFGMIAVEAMACGCPLVASRAPAIPEIAGDAAEYFDPYDIDEMAFKIEAVLTDEQLRFSLVKRGYERVKKYNWNCSVMKLLQIIEEVGRRESRTRMRKRGRALAEPSQPALQQLSDPPAG